MSILDVLKLVANGGVGGICLVGLYLLLNQWTIVNKFLLDMREGFANDLKDLSTSFTKALDEYRETSTVELKDARLAFTSELREVTQSMMAKHDAVQARVDTIHEANMKVQNETTLAITGLKESIDDLKEKVK